MGLDGSRRSARVVVVCGVLLLGAGAFMTALAAPVPTNNNRWQITRPDGSDLFVDAHAFEVKPDGTLVFSVVLGSGTFILKVLPPGSYKCIHATRLASDDTPPVMYVVPPPVPAGCF